MSILSIFASAAGCKKAPVDDTSALENPPPKPPNCPDLPELKNITLKDGSIADVRIVQFRETKLYIPAELIRDTFYDINNSRIEYLDQNKISYVPNNLLSFNPDVHEFECPGVIHKVRSDVDSVNSGIGIYIGKNKDDIKNIAPNSVIKFVNFIYWKEGFADETYASPGGGHESGSVKFFPDVYANYNISQEGVVRPEIGSPDWIIRRESVREFANWLATPPRERDNKRIFNLGAKQ